MSDTLIASLNQRVSELTQQNANLTAAVRETRRELKASKETAETLKGQLKAAATERETWKGKAEAAPTEQARRVAELEGQLRTRDHRDGFRAAALKAGVKPDAVADLYQLSGLKPPEQGDIDPAGFAGFLDGAKAARSWAFGANEDPDAGGSSGGAPGGTTQADRKPPLQGGQGGGRGALDTSASNRFVVRSADLADADWVQSNWSRYTRALQEGAVVYAD